MPTPSRFETCLAFTWRPDFDGQPLHTDPHDRGGATAWGVTLATYAAWRAKHGILHTTVQDLANASKDELARLIKEDFWDAVHGDELPVGIDRLVYDFGYGSGSGTSIKVLQQVLGVAADGVIGPHTMAALHAAYAADPHGFVARLGARHDAFYRSLADYQWFGRGWSRRNADRVALALAEIPHVPVAAPAA